MNSTLLQNNRDFLFIYEASQCNPNGDPDQENRPRMDYDTQTNLVTDVRLKRYVRDYLKQSGHEIFVDMESEAKVSMDERMKRIVEKLLIDDTLVQNVLADNPEMFNAFLDLKSKEKDKLTQAIFSDKPVNKGLNIAILAGLVKLRFADVRMFGSAFAVKGFNRAMTGPVQINWGYSLNKVFLMDSNTISSIMNDDSSTFGKDYRVKYSLLAFQGTMNANAAKATGFSEKDVEIFREALWKGISASPTRSKLNQYPKLYVEVEYNQGYHNGYFGDLRQYVDCAVKGNADSRTVRQFTDLEVSFSRLESILKEHTGLDKAIKKVKVEQSFDLKFN